MRIPSQRECFQLIFEMDMLDNIVAHSIQVRRVATVLLDLLEIQQIRLNRGLVQASALLHDITKTRSFKTRENHANTGARLLAERGYPEVGQIVGQHVQLDVYSISGAPLEAEIVNYADKRVLHDQIVSLSDRMNYIRERYGTVRKRRERLYQLWEEMERLEERLFVLVRHSPEEIGSFISSEDCSQDLSAYREVCKSMTSNNEYPYPSK